MDKLKYIKFEESQGQYTDNIPIGVDSKNVDLKIGYNLEEVLGDYNFSEGTIEKRLTKIRTDKTLTLSDVAADAQAVGQKIKNFELKIANIITPQDYGAVGNGITDDTDAFQETINFANKNNCIIKCSPFKKYKITRLTCLSYTILDLNNSTIEINTIDLFNPEDTIFAWDGPHDIIIKNGTIIKINSLGICHNQRVLIENIHFKNCKGNHFIQICASKDIIINNCIFEGQAPLTGNKQMIQIDNAIPGYFNHFIPKDTSLSLDGYKSKNITIENCIFKPSEDQGFKQCHCGIGGHGYQLDYNENIIIRNNRVYASDNTEAYCYKLLWMKNIIFENNYSYGGQFSLAICSGVENAKIINNIFQYGGSVPFKNSYIIYISPLYFPEEASLEEIKDKNIYIINNILQGVSNSSTQVSAINSRNIENLFIGGNVIKDVYYAFRFNEYWSNVYILKNNYINNKSYITKSSTETFLPQQTLYLKDSQTKISIFNSIVKNEEDSSWNIKLNFPLSFFNKLTFVTGQVGNQTVQTTSFYAYNFVNFYGETEYSYPIYFKNGQKFLLSWNISENPFLLKIIKENEQDEDIPQIRYIYGSVE